MAVKLYHEIEYLSNTTGRILSRIGIRVGGWPEDVTRRHYAALTAYVGL